MRITPDLVFFGFIYPPAGSGSVLTTEHLSLFFPYPSQIQAQLQPNKYHTHGFPTMHPLYQHPLKRKRTTDTAIFTLGPTFRLLSYTQRKPTLTSSSLSSSAPAPAPALPAHLSFSHDHSHSNRQTNSHSNSTLIVSRHKHSFSSSSSSSSVTSPCSAALVFLSSSLTSSPGLPAPVPASGSFMQVLSPIIGWTVLAGSIFYKVPQIVKIWKARSARGVSFLSYAIETVTTSISALYAFKLALPFDTYGESFFVTIQNIVIVLSIVLFSSGTEKAGGASSTSTAKPASTLTPANHHDVFEQNKQKFNGTVLVFGAIYLLSVLLLLYVFPFTFLTLLQIATIPIANLSKLPQIFLVFRQKSTGSLSMTTLTLNVLGSLARIITNMVQVKDPWMMLAAWVAAIMNGTVFAQFVYYSSKKNAIEDPQTAAEKAAAVAAAAVANTTTTTNTNTNSTPA